VQQVLDLTVAEKAGTLINPCFNAGSIKSSPLGAKVACGFRNRKT